MKKSLALCAALFVLLVGCRGKKTTQVGEPDWVSDQSQEGLAFQAPADWTSSKIADTTVYTTPQKQVMTVNTVQSANRSGDILNTADREDFYFIARQEARDDHFTSEDVIDIGGQNGLRVGYETLNGMELMYVVHVGVVKEDRMYFFAFLMPENANDPSDFDRVVSTARFL